MNIITNDALQCELGIAALRVVNDPEMNLNVVDLGLIYQMDFDAAVRTVYVTMTLTVRFCPMGTSIATGVQRAMEAAFPGWHIELSVTFTPRWTRDRIGKAPQSLLNT